jgi:hypothetical protein
MDQQKNQGQQTQDNMPRGNPERGRGNSQDERNRSSEGKASRSSDMPGSGISNRGMEREMSEQEELPERGSSDADRSDR